MNSWMFQNGISSWGGIRKLSLVFTEQRVAMLSGVLKSETAVRMHIQIIRVFAKMKEMLLTDKWVFRHLVFFIFFFDSFQ